MVKSFLAGIMISIAAAIYLKVGGVVGAFLFATGLLTILHFKLNLFTGKAGLLFSGDIDFPSLMKIYCGNLIGCVFGAELIYAAGLGDKIVEAATAIVQVRLSNMWYENIILGIFCGILMYIAVSWYDPSAPFLTIFCVAGFILMGANHCVADMVYICLGASPAESSAAAGSLICTTIGNIIGCNIIPVLMRIANKANE